MTLAMHNLNLSPAAQGIVATRQLKGVLLEWNDLISITVNVENGDVGPGQRRQSVDGVVLRQVLS